MVFGYFLAWLKSSILTWYIVDESVIIVITCHTSAALIWGEMSSEWNRIIILANTNGSLSPVGRNTIMIHAR